MKSVNHKRAWYIINGITLYRTIAAPFLLVLLFMGRYDVFKWMLLVSFFTDFIDGFLARQYKVTSVVGTRLDSIGDDLTVLVAVIGLFMMRPEFIRAEKMVLILLLALFVIQVGYALIRYGKMTNFHTYLAKAAAILQGVFLLLAFFLDEPSRILFYAAAIVTMLELMEETVMVGLLPEWETDVKGIFSVLNRKKSRDKPLN